MADMMIDVSSRQINGNMLLKTIEVSHMLQYYVYNNIVVLIVYSVNESIWNKWHNRSCNLEEPSGGMVHRDNHELLQSFLVQDTMHPLLSCTSTG